MICIHYHNLFYIIYFYIIAFSFLTFFKLVTASLNRVTWNHGMIFIIIIIIIIDCNELCYHIIIDNNDQ